MHGKHARFWGQQHLMGEGRVFWQLLSVPQRDANKSKRWPPLDPFCSFLAPVQIACKADLRRLEKWIWKENWFGKCGNCMWKPYGFGLPSLAGHHLCSFSSRLLTHGKQERIKVSVLSGSLLVSRLPSSSLYHVHASAEHLEKYDNGPFMQIQVRILFGAFST